MNTTKGLEVIELIDNRMPIPKNNISQTLEKFSVKWDETKTMPRKKKKKARKTLLEQFEKELMEYRETWDAFNAERRKIGSAIRNFLLEL